MDKKYKLVLINANQKYKHYGTQVGTAELMRKKAVNVPTALTIIAGLTPDHFEIEIIDEAVSMIDTLPEADLIGITTLTGTIGRVYELSGQFMDKGIPVILGGIHASMSPDESINHADAVVIGEAELIWNKVLEDFESGSLKKFYNSSETFDFKKLPKQRWDLVDMNNYLTVSIQATRGCPYDCEFCGVTKIFGPKRRYRDIEDVVEQIKTLPTNKFIFADDNLTFNKKYARELMEAIKPLNVTWNCQSSIEIAEQDELLELMADAGCEQILIGLESLNDESLKETNKKQNLKKDYYDVIRKVQKHGIFVAGSFIFGLDNDKAEDLQNIVKFTEDAPLPMALITPLASLPGSELTKRLATEDRLVDLPVDMRGSFYPSVKYANFTAEEMFTTYITALRDMFSYDSVMKKAVKLFKDGDFASVKQTYNIPGREKFRISVYLLITFFFSKYKAKRRLFSYLVKLVRNNTLCIERMVFFLIYIEGARNFLIEEIWAKEHEHLTRIREHCN